MSKFVKTVVTTYTEIKSLRDVYLDNSAIISVVPRHNQQKIELVIGGKYHNRFACVFTRSQLGDLIDELEAIREAMSGIQPTD